MAWVVQRCFVGGRVEQAVLRFAGTEKECRWRGLTRPGGVRERSVPMTVDSKVQASGGKDVPLWFRGAMVAG